MGVNAAACAPRRLVVPEDDPGGWSEPLGTATRAPSASESLPPEPAAWWRSGLGRAASGPLAFGDVVIAGMAVDRNLTVIERQTGDRLWRKRLNAPGTTGPLFAGNWLIVATGGFEGRVYGFTLRGRKRWERRIAHVRGPLATAGDLLVAVTETGGVVALEVRSGEPRWTRRLARATRAGVMAHDGHLLVASDDSIFRLSLDEGAITARGALPGTPVAAPARQGDTLVFATADGQVGAIDATSLTTLWTVDVNGPVFGGPAIARDSAFVVTLRGDLWAIPLGNPAGARAMPVGAPVRAPAAPVRAGVLIGTLAGEILLVRGDSISRQGRVEGPIEQPIIVRDGTMYVVDGRGRIHAWR
jgi:outer membrane protein assembly factor BamB